MCTGRPLCLLLGSGFPQAERLGVVPVAGNSATGGTAMLRKWIGIASVIAVAAVMLAADASQARERRFFGRRNRSNDYDSTTYVASDGAYMPASDTMVVQPQDGRRSGRRSRGYASNG